MAEPKQIEFAAATAKSQLKLSGQIIMRFSLERYDNDCAGMEQFRRAPFILTAALAR